MRFHQRAQNTGEHLRADHVARGDAHGAFDRFGGAGCGALQRSG